ncbi:Tripartite ATP-independent transporter, DctM component [Bradyrhizobium arachidis]|nr:Tripartite ATP-independent transporter, DctM component [Bradyrhizobium arachidis]
MAAVAPVLFPEMRQRGAKPGDLVALLAATGAQTETIPPSLVPITIGSVTGVSISALFTGGLLPGVVLAVMLAAVVWWRYRREDLSHVKRATGRQIGHAFVIAIPAIALPFVIRTAVVEGVATATEVSPSASCTRPARVSSSTASSTGAASIRCWSRQPLCQGRFCSSSERRQAWPGR